MDTFIGGWAKFSEGTSFWQRSGGLRGRLERSGSTARRARAGGSLLAELAPWRAPRPPLRRECSLSPLSPARKYPPLSFGPAEARAAAQLSQREGARRQSTGLILPCASAAAGGGRSHTPAGGGRSHPGFRFRAWVLFWASVPPTLRRRPKTIPMP
jgi:hypothetical protein